MGLGHKIRGLREEIGMSQAQLAAQAELSQGYLLRFLRGMERETPVEVG